MDGGVWLLDGGGLHVAALDEEVEGSCGGVVLVNGKGGG